MSWPEPTAGTAASLVLSSLLILGCYLIGCFNTGYYLIRWRRGNDIRGGGSGSTGATNAGRSLGAMGFILTLTLDMAKGALAVWLARHFRLGSWGILLSMLAVIAGHIWPVQLRFRGGKGVAPLLGALLAADCFIILVAIGAFLLVFAFLRRFTLSGLTALALTPPVLAWWEKPPGRAFGFLILVLPVLYAHRQNLREDLTFIRGAVAGKSPEGPPSREE